MTLTARERELLADLPNDEWVRPMDIGGRDGSNHSYLLNRLVQKGYAERKDRGGSLAGIRRSFVYRKKFSATPTGQ